MAVTIIATPGAVNANSYLTLAEATAYFETRLPITQWDTADQEALLVMATRVFDALFTPRRVLINDPKVGGLFYRTSATWTGAPASIAQALSWPRTGMLTKNGADILSTTIPSEIKNAVAELAGQLAIGDRTLDNDVIAQGIASIKAGSVSLTFRDSFTEANVIPDAVMNLLIPSWLTDELFEFVLTASFEVV